MASLSLTGVSPAVMSWFLALARSCGKRSSTAMCTEVRQSSKVMPSPDVGEDKTWQVFGPWEGKISSVSLM